LYSYIDKFLYKKAINIIVVFGSKYYFFNSLSELI